MAQVKGLQEAHVLDLCDEILGHQGLRQHCFEFLRCDPGKNGRPGPLRVDAWYPELRLVVEYHGAQHDRAVRHFDKPDRVTVSGVHRGEQRRIYDQRRRDVLPAHGIRLVEIRCHQLDHAGTSLRFNREADRLTVAGLLTPSG